MPEKLTLAGWEAKVGDLPPLVNHLAYDLSCEGRSPANAVAEAVKTLHVIGRAGRTQRGGRLSYRTQHAVQAAVREWEALEFLAGARETVPVDDALMAALTEAADSMRKATQHEKVGHTGKGLWGQKGLQLPAYIQHIANDIKEKRGMPESRAIAIAVSAVKKWAAGIGKNIDAGTRAAARKAVAEWEKLKATHNKSKTREAMLVVAASRLKHQVGVLPDQATFAKRYAHRLSVIEGVGSALRDGSPLAVRSARNLLEAPEDAPVEALIEALAERKVAAMLLVEALGYSATPIRARTADKHRGQFHGMHGTQKAVRTRTLLPDPPENGDGVVSPEDEERVEQIAEMIREAAPTLAPQPTGTAFEQLHPRAAHGQFGSKGGPAAGQGAGAGAAAAPPPNAAALAAAIQQADPQFQKEMAATAAFVKANPGVLSAGANRAQMAGDQIQNVGYAPDPAGLAQFQKDYGLPVTGQMDAATMDTVAVVYRQNSRTAASRVPDFSGIAGAGARVSARRQRTAGRTTLGKTSASKLRAAAEQEGTLAERLVEAVTVVSTSTDAPLLIGKPPGTNHANTGPEGGPETRQPGGDDYDFDEPILAPPPNLREREGVHACATCVHFSPKGIVTQRSVMGGCMLWSYPVDRLDLCDDWLTLTPPDAPLRVFEARLQEAEELGSGDEIVSARAALRVMRERLGDEAEVAELPHVADKDLAAAVTEGTLTAAKRKKLKKGSFAIPETQSYPIHDESHARNALSRVAQHGTDEEKKRVRAAVKRKYPNIGSSQEAGFDPVKHPRARGGKFAEVLGKLQGLKHGETFHTGGLSVRKTYAGYEMHTGSHKITAMSAEHAAAHALEPEGEAHALVSKAINTHPDRKKEAVERAVAHLQTRYAARGRQGATDARSLDAERERLARHVGALSDEEIAKSGLKDRAAWMRRYDTGSGPRPRDKKPGSKMSRRSGHGLLTE